jgi:saccharopine dehydrogenase-like NADP-dependent oxidoreductase
MRILVLGGAGLMGSGTIRDLLSPLSSGITKVVAVDSSASRLAALAPEDPRLETRVVDISDRGALRDVLGECDLCINGVPTLAGHQMAIFEACYDARRTYVDYGGLGVYTVQQKAEHSRWTKAGVTAVIGLGADPGTSNVLCRAVADRLEHIERIRLYWAATKVGPESPVLVPPYSLATMLAEYANPSQQFIDGRLQTVPPQSGVETIDLPQPWGRTTFMYTQHSEPLTVPFAPGIAEKGIRECTWKMSLPAREHEAWVGLVKAGFRPDSASILQTVIDRNIAERRSAIPEQESYEVHFVIGDGSVAGRARRVICRVIGRPDPLYAGYADAATSMSMSIGVQQILRLPLRGGVWAPEEYFDVTAYLQELQKRHFVVELSEGEAPSQPTNRAAR